MQSVLKLEKYLTQRNETPFRPYTGVLAECRRLVAERIGLALASAVEGMDTELQQRRQSAITAEQGELLIEAQFQLRSVGIAINRRFHEVYEREFQHRITPEPALRSIYGSEGGGLLELSLADDDQITDELLVQNLAKLLSNQCEAELKDLRVRVAHMLGESALRENKDPIGPEAILAALKEIVWQLGNDRSARVLLLELFAAALGNTLQTLYKELNALLIARKVLPRIRHAVKRDKPRMAARHMAAQSPESPHDEAETSGIIHRLFEGDAGNDARYGFAGGAATGQGTGGIAGNQAGVVQVLNRLQLGERNIALGPDNFTIDLEECATKNVLHGLIESGIGRHLGTLDSIIIDVVAALFDYIFEDPHVPGPIKGLIGRLQIPVLKRAMLDHGFFSNRTHPARRFVNTLAQSAAAWGGEISQESGLYAFAEPLVSRIQNSVAEDSDVFSDAQTELDNYLAEQDRRAEAHAATLTPDLEQQERLEVARMVADNATTAYLANLALPESVRDFIGETWHQVLVKAALSGSRDGTLWQEAATTMDNLVWSVQPIRTPEERQRLVKLLPSLLGGLRGGLAEIAADDGLRDAFFAELMKLHAAAVKAGMSAAAVSVPAAPHPAPVEANTPPDAAEAASESVLEPLTRGTWISLRDEAGQIRRLKLSWISPARTMYLFTNHEGQRAVALTQSELSARFRRGDAILDDDDLPLLDRIVDTVLDDFDART